MSRLNMRKELLKAFRHDRMRQLRSCQGDVRPTDLLAEERRGSFRDFITRGQNGSNDRSAQRCFGVTGSRLCAWTHRLYFGGMVIPKCSSPHRLGHDHLKTEATLRESYVLSLTAEKQHFGSGEGSTSTEGAKKYHLI